MRDARHKRPSITRYVLIGGIAILMASTASWWRAPLASLLWNVLTPIAPVRDYIGNATVTTWTGLRYGQTLSAENIVLRAELADAKQQVIDRDILREENITLREQSGRTDTASHHTVIADIISRPPQMPYDSLIIDAGSDHGITSGDVALAGSAIIGKVSEVFSNTARVELFSFANKKTDGMLAGNFTTVEGQGSGTMTTRLPSDIPIIAGDTISLSGAGGGVFGTVSHLDTPASGALKTVYLQISANPFTLKSVTIDTDTKLGRSAIAPIDTTSPQTASSSAKTVKKNK